jgi:hypothetical protein
MWAETRVLNGPPWRCPFWARFKCPGVQRYGMALLAALAKPALAIALAGLAMGAAFVLLRATRPRVGVEELLPRIDVAAYNDL